jgi:predicted nucleic acid-binding protein
LTVCIDASFPLLFILRDPAWEPAFLLWQRWMQRGEGIVSPPIFHPEVTSILRERMYRQEMTAEQAQGALDWTLSLPVGTATDNAALQRRAFSFAVRFNRPKVYDSQYLAMADLIGCDLWTADKRLINTVGGSLPWVRHVERTA